MRNMRGGIVMSKKTGLELLREPFLQNQISKLPRPYKKDSPKGNCQECGAYHALPALHLDYVGHAALTDRLLDCDPLWFWEPLAFVNGLPAFDATGGLWIRLTVCGHSRIGYGHANSKQHMDAGAREKEVIGDALRNAAMRFGAALDLWHKGNLHVDEDVEPEIDAPAAKPLLSPKGLVNAMAALKDGRKTITFFIENFNLEPAQLLALEDISNAE